MSDTLYPLPAAGSDFLEVLQTFLANEDAARFNLQFGGQLANLWGYVVTGGTHGTIAGLTATPAALIAFPGGYYTTESNPITYDDNVVTWVIAHKNTTGNQGAYTRVSGTHYLLAVTGVAPTLPQDCVRLMKVTTAGGAITVVDDYRLRSPLQIANPFPYVRLIGTEAGGRDISLFEVVGSLLFSRNDGTIDTPVWTGLIGWVPANALLTLVSGVTTARTQNFPDKDGTFAMLSDISGSAFAPATAMLFRQAAAPAGWTRVLTVNDSMVRIVSGALADAGSWTLSGLTVSAHTHTLGAHTHALTTANDVGYDPGGDLRVTAATSGVPSSDVTGSTAVAVASDASWRPVHTDVILCTKD